MNRVVHFEIHADDIERCKKFYGDFFGWEFPEWMPGYWGVMTAPIDSPEKGINGGMLLRDKSCKPSVPGSALNAFACTVQVDSIDDIIEKILKAGGIEAMPKFSIMNMAWQAYYIDTEGNLFGIHQEDKNAK